MDIRKYCRIALPRMDCHGFLLFGVDIPAKKIQGKQTGNFRLPHAGIGCSVQLSNFRGGTDRRLVGRYWVGSNWNLPCEQTKLRTTSPLSQAGLSPNRTPLTIPLKIAGEVSEFNSVIFIFPGPVGAVS